MPYDPLAHLPAQTQTAADVAQVDTHVTHAYLATRTDAHKAVHIAALLLTGQEVPVQRAVALSQLSP